MPGFKVNMQGVGKPLDEGEYPVVLTKVTAGTTRNGQDRLSFACTIRDSGTEFDGRTVFRGFVFNYDPEKTDQLMMTKTSLFDTCVAFGADPEEISEGDVDFVEFMKDFYGKKAVAKIGYRPNMEDPNKPYQDVRILPSDL